jgi:hypothetical protein
MSRGLGSRTALAATAAAATAVAVAAAPAGGASSPPCRTKDLHVTHVFWAGATGNQINVFRVRNVSGRTCHTFGWFGVQLLGRRGHKLPTDSRRVTHDFFGHQPKHRVTLRPNRRASFRITTVTAAGRRCVDAWKIRIIAPDDTARATVKVRRRLGHLYACQHGRIRIAPIQAGDGAKPRH